MRESRILIALLLISFIITNASAGIDPSITINDVNGYTATSTPSLTLSADENIEKMAFSCTEGETGWTDWIDYATTYSDFNIESDGYDCMPGDGNKTVFVKFKDVNDVESGPVSDSTYLDKTPPTISLNYPDEECGDIICTADNNQKIKFTVRDLESSGVDKATIKVVIGVTESTAFNAVNHCKLIEGKNYECEYYETALKEHDKPYVIKIEAKDKVGNKATLTKTIQYIDTIAPAPVTGLVYEKGPGEIKVSWNASPETDLKEYRVYYSTENCDFNLETGVLAGSTTQTTLTIEELDSDQSYHISVSAVDYSENESELELCNETGISPDPADAPSRPSLDSDTHEDGEWSDERDVEITWDAVPGADRYLYTWGDEDGETTATSFSKNNVSHGTYEFKIKACAGDNCSSTRTFTVRIDYVVPSRPRDFDASMDNGDVRLDWSVPSTIGSSGIKEFEIYRGTTSGFSPTSGNRIYRGSGGSGTNRSYVDTGVSTGRTYYYRIRAVGNNNKVSDYASTSITTTTFRVTIDVPEYAKAGSMTIRVSASERISGAEVFIRETGKAWTRIDGPANYTSRNITHTFYSGDAGVYEVKVEGDNISENVWRRFEVITKEPSVTWIKPEPGATISGTERLEVKLDTPEHKIEKVSFYYNETRIAEITQAGDEGIYWIASWDTRNVSTGSYSLKATALDKAGNEGSASISVSVEGVEPEPKEPEEESEEKIEEAGEERLAAANAMQKAKGYGFSFNENAEILYSEGLELLETARQQSNDGNYEDAVETAEQALAKFSKFEELYGFEEKITRVVEIDEEEAGVLANEFLLPDSIADSEAKKTLKVLMVKDNGIEQYYVTVLIQFTADHEVFILERIPKELAASAALIESETEFEILRENPVILFKVDGNKTSSVQYSIKKPFTAEEYAQLKADQVFEPKMFAVINPPEEIGFIEVLMQWLLPVLLLIAVIVVIAVLAKFYSAGRKSGEKQKSQEKEESHTPLSGAISKADKSFKIPKIRLGGKKEERPPRWAYKKE